MTLSLDSPAENLTVDLPAKAATIGVSEELMNRLSAMADVDARLG